MDVFSNFFYMKLCYVFSLESPHLTGTHNIQFSICKKENHP